MSNHVERPYAGRAGLYAAHRWDYAPAAVRFVVTEAGLGPDSRVADLGSGTGMLARHLVAHTGIVFGVEPDPEMRGPAEEALAAEPSFRSVAATAEATGLPGGSIDLITVGQALHWFDAEQAKGEMLRILKPGGRLAVLWNHTDSPALSEAIGQLPGWGALRPGRHRVDDLLPVYFGAGGCVRRDYRVCRTEEWEGFLGVLLSAAGAPLEGDPAFPAFRDAARQVFDRFSTEGALQVDVVTEAAVGRPTPAAGEDANGAARHRGSTWNFRALIALLAIAALLQFTFLPCLCAIGTAKSAYALAFDILIATRMLIAWLIGESNRGWIFYAVLTITSPLWIELASRIVIGPH
jgi:SAM-dependent methyltransferase